MGISRMPGTRAVPPRHYPEVESEDILVSAIYSRHGGIYARIYGPQG